MDDKVLVSSCLNPGRDSDEQACDKGDVEDGEGGEDGDSDLDAETAQGAQTGGDAAEPAPTALIEEEEGEGKGRECAERSGVEAKPGTGNAEEAAEQADAADKAEDCSTAPVDAVEAELTAIAAAPARSAAGLFEAMASAVTAQMPSEST